MHIRPARSARLRAVIALAAVASVAAFLPVTGSHGVAQAAGVGDCNADAAWPANNKAFADQVVTLVNQHRAALGLVQLKVSPTLTASAVWKARHMAYYSYMQHDDPAPPIARLWYQRVQACGYTGSGMGENIAYGYTTPQDVMNGWLNSPGHKANIENASFRVIGVGVAGSTVFWAQDFGTTDDSGVVTPPSDTTVPSAPGLLTGTAASTSQVNLNWGAATDNLGVAGYRVYRGAAQVGTTAGTSYSDTGLGAGTPYSYTVRAYDAAGNLGPASNSVTVTTQSGSSGGGGASGGTAYANSVTVQFGTVTSGYVSNLRAQDGATFNATSQSVGWWGNFTLPTTPASLSVTYAGSVTASCTQALSLWDWTTGTWQLLDSRAASSMTQRVTVTATGSLGRFVSQSTGAARVRVGCTRADGTSFTVRADQLTIAT